MEPSPRPQPLPANDAIPGQYLEPPSRPPWTTAIEDVSYTIRNSISSWASIRLDLVEDSCRNFDALDVEKDAATPAIPPPSPSHLPRMSRPLSLMSLPIEMQIHIIRQMPFGDIERLRRTCRHYHQLASPQIMRLTFGATSLRNMLFSHCHLCLHYDTSRETLLAAEAGRDYPFSAKCVPCALRARDRRLSRVTIAEKVTLGNAAKVWVCRWCSHPIVTQAAQGHAQFHLMCYREYTGVLVWYFLAGWLQLAIGVVAAALAWKYFRGDLMVFAPSVAAFIMMWLCIFLLLFRGNSMRTYGTGLVMEGTLLGLWIPQLYLVIQSWAAAEPSDVPSSTKAAAIIFMMNALFRLLNVLGNIFLWTEYDISRRRHEYVPRWKRRTVNRAIAWLIFWTYPQSVEQRWKKPPRLIEMLKDKFLHKFRLRK